MQGRYNVLFLCTGNSARSIMAEAIMNHKGRPNFSAYSAGSHPAGFVNPYALKMIETARLPTAGLRSKPWDEFAKPGAPELHFVFTVCDSRAGSLPSLAGATDDRALGRPDPAVAGRSPEQIERAFRDAFMVLDRRISFFLCLPLGSLDKLAIQKELDRIGNKERP